jgi:hypothetical protein
MFRRELLFLNAIRCIAKATTVNRISLTAFCLLLAAVACLLPASAFAEPIQWVIVGDPGNTADTAPSGYGAVATSFQIMKYEFTKPAVHGLPELRG